MLAARDLENRVAAHHNGAALKQQQQAGRLYPKTPVKIPLNDENATHAVGGAKSVLGNGNRPRGNENIQLTSKRSNFVTPVGKFCDRSVCALVWEYACLTGPVGPRNRAVLGDKTTNAKTRGLQTTNVKGEKTQSKPPGTVRPKQKQPQAETQRLQIHAEKADPLSEEEPEYCPPRPKDLPYESDVFPEGGLTFEGLKREKLFEGYYQYYFNPVGEDGKSAADKELEERNRKALDDGDRKIQQAMDDLDWSIKDVPDTKESLRKKPTAPTTKQSAKASVPPRGGLTRRPLSTLTARNAAETLSIDDGTKSLQRKTARAAPAIRVPKKKTTPAAMPSLRASRQPALAKKSSMEIRKIEANSRSTIGYNKGRATASALAQRSTKLAVRPGQAKPKASTLPRTESTASAGSDETMIPTRFARTGASTTTEDQEWKARVPFLSIFSPEDDDGLNGIGGGPPGALEDDDDDFVMNMPE